MTELLITKQRRNMGLLSFLKTATVEEVIPQAKTGGGPARKQRNPNPTFLGIRLFKDGSVYPSQALVDKFDLEYRGGTKELVPATAAVGKEGEEGYVPAKPATTKQVFPENISFGNGFDVIDSQAWGAYKGDGKLIFIGAVPKNEAKVDLFGRVGYDAEGKPITSVMDQGTKTYGLSTLIPMLEDVYGITFSEEKEFIDLAVLNEIEGVNITQQFSRPIIFAPKRVVRGEDKGKDDVVRRENMSLYLLFPQELMAAEETTAQPAEVEQKAEVSA